MRVAVPASGSPVLKNPVHAHVASAPFFVVVDMDTGEVTDVENPHTEGSGRELNPVGVVRDLKVDVLICAGIGSWAVRLIEAGGTKVYLAHGGLAEAAVEDFKSGRLTRAY